MRRLALLLACSVLPVDAQHNRLTAEERAAGWRLLFDGKTMAGWSDPSRRNPPGDAWKIEDDCLAAQPNPRLVEDLVSAESFGDFELVFDWRISPGGNSGVKYRIQELVMIGDQSQQPPLKFEDLVELSIRNRRTDRPAKGQEYVVGFEYQIIDNKASSDAKYGPIRATASLYELVPVAKDVTRPVGAFNHSRLLVKGLHTEHWLNGEKVLDTMLDSRPILEGLAERWGRNSAVYEMLGKRPRRDCPISLQNHTFPAWFRNIKIRANWSKTLDLVAGNWQFNVIYDYMTGTPTPMPNAIPLRDPRLPDQTFSRWFDTCTLLSNGTRSSCASSSAPLAWAQLAPNQSRTSSSYFPNIRNDWKANINMSLFKQFPVRERLLVELRGEVFNATNSPIYAAPTTSVTSALFGVVAISQQNFPRNMQFALRVRF